MIITLLFRRRLDYGFKAQPECVSVWYEPLARDQRLMCSLRFRQILANIFAGTFQILRTSNKVKRRTTDSWIQSINRAIDHIVGHLEAPIRLADLARVARLSPFHFHRVFQVIVGETPAEYIRRMRLEKALSLMALQRKRRLTDIALSCGFSSSADFSRSFRHRYGVAPSAFDTESWRAVHSERLEHMLSPKANVLSVTRLPSRANPEGFRVRVRQCPQRTVAYLRVLRPYEGDRVLKAAERLQSWAEAHQYADRQWLGFQWENPEITRLEDCHYCVAVQTDQEVSAGDIGSCVFPPMQVAELEIRGSIELELRALQWLYGTWLPRSGFEPDDLPCFEAWLGRPFEHGTDHFELRLQLPVR